MISGPTLCVFLETLFGQNRILRYYGYLGDDIEWIRRRWVVILGTNVWITGAQNWHIVSLLGDVTSPTTVAHYVSMTCSKHREALTAAPTEDGVHIQAIRVQG